MTSLSPARIWWTSQGKKGHNQQYLLNSYAIRVIVLTKKLCTGQLPAKTEQAVKRHTDVKNYSNTYKSIWRAKVCLIKKKFKGQIFSKKLRL